MVEQNRLEFTRNEVSTTRFSQTTKGHFARPDVWNIHVPLPPDRGEQHLGILKNFAATIRGEASLIAPAAEGLHSVELANAMLYSSLRGETVELPLPASGFARLLKKLVATSRFKRKKNVRATTAGDFAKSF